MTNKVQKENMSTQAIWNIRDARGLSHEEKVFLFVVASRGVMYSEWQKAAEDMGMKKTRYFKVRKSLIEKDLVEEGRRMDDTTVYRVKEDVLATYVPVKEKADNSIVWTDSVSQTGHSVFGNGESASETDHSGGPETKVTMKVTEKETSKVTNETVANAPVSPDVDNKDEAKGEEGTKDVDSSSLSSVVTDSPLPSKKNSAGTAGAVEETRPVRSLFAEKKAELLAKRATETDEIEEVLSAAEHKEEARTLFLDPSFRPNDDQDVRARWAAFTATPVTATA
ncbi:hypothetical protein [Streptomyces sp. NPDC102462]|uniref:hypothetical protein n=1 Tax=Streptomyces sp. NPDC102462 TaxID=3366178 RepID=UPI0037F2CAEC